MENIKRAIIDMLEAADLATLQIIFSFVSGVCKF